MEAAVELKVDDALVGIVEYWTQDFAVKARHRLKESLKKRKQPVVLDDSGGRYTLAEALRCLGRFGAKAAAQRAISVSGADPDMLCDSSEDAWRKRFQCFVERQWFCPITSPFSPF